MNILREYSFDQVRKNRHTSVSIMLAVLIASSFLCTLFVFVQSFWNQMVQQQIYVAGDWDAELLDVPAERLAMIEDNGGVDAILVKGDNQTALLPEGTSLPHLLIQNCDSDYWNAMYEKNRILRGRIPQAPGEIVVGKDFFLQNASYRIGDTLNLSLEKQEGECFARTENVSLTIVGELDVSVSSGYGGYLAYGWMEREKLEADREVVVYLQMKQRGKVYRTVPQIAEAIGLLKDEYGNYPCRYHSLLLGWYGVYAPGTFFQGDLPKLFLELLLAAVASMAVFAYIIRGVFGIAAKQKVRQLGILKSVGAGPGQIGRTILHEACMLSVIPILLSVGLGYLMSFCVLSVYSDMTREVFGSKMEVSLSPVAALVAVVFSFATVLLAAYGPAKQMAGLLPIEAIKGEQRGISMKKAKDHPFLTRRFGFLGEIAANQIHAGKKLYHTCMMTLSLCMLLAFGFLAVFTASDISNAQAERDNPFNVNITLKTGERIEDGLLAELAGLPEVQERAVYAMANCATWISESEQQAGFSAEEGSGADTASNYVAWRDGRYRVPCLLVGMEQEAYKNCLQRAGVENTSEFSAIFVSRVERNPETEEEMIPRLNLKQGQQVELTEKYSDSIQGDYVFGLEVAAVLPAMPDIGFTISDYTLPIILPMEEYYAIIGNFCEESKVFNYRNYINLVVPQGMDEQIQREAEQICSAWLGSNDFFTSSKTERMKSREKMTGAMMLVVYCLAALFGIVGIASALSAILNSLHQRRKEFAMLRSVGVDEKGIRLLLGLEGFLLAVKPVLLGLPLLVILCVIQCLMMNVSVMEFLSVFPLGGLAIYIVLVVFVINGIYVLASKRIREDGIVEAIKDDTV